MVDMPFRSNDIQYFALLLYEHADRIVSGNAIGDVKYNSSEHIQLSIR